MPTPNSASQAIQLKAILGRQCPSTAYRIRYTDNALVVTRVKESSKEKRARTLLGFGPSGFDNVSFTWNLFPALGINSRDKA
jgi:hypothetical protein